MSAKRIQRRRTKGWRMPSRAVNCCRPGEWGNPYRVGDTIKAFDIRDRQTPAIDITITPALAVALYETFIADRGWHAQIRRELGGKTLVCWCEPGDPCHADVLLRIANEAIDA